MLCSKKSESMSDWAEASDVHPCAVTAVWTPVSKTVEGVI